MLPLTSGRLGRFDGRRSFQIANSSSGSKNSRPNLCEFARQLPLSSSRNREASHCSVRPTQAFLDPCGSNICPSRSLRTSNRKGNSHMGIAPYSVRLSLWELGPRVPPTAQSSPTAARTTARLELVGCCGSEVVWRLTRGAIAADANQRSAHAKNYACNAP